MAWIEYHTNLMDHWKIKMLSNELGVDYATALGHMSILWLWVAVFAPKGDLHRFTDQQIREAARCSLQKFCKSTLQNCFLMTDKERINDWHKHGLKLLESNRKRIKRHREKKRNGNVTVTSTLPNLTLPNQPIYKDRPSLDDVRSYCLDRKNGVDPETFINFYESKGWMVGRNKMKDWRAAVRTWEKRTPINTNKAIKTPDDLDKKIFSKLNKIATKDMIKGVMREIPENLWWKVDSFLNKRYPEGGNGFIESERELIKERQDFKDLTQTLCNK
jgi:hypothetical protein